MAVFPLASPLLDVGIEEESMERATRRLRLRSIGALLLAGAALGGSSARAHDQGLADTKLVVVDKTAAGGASSLTFRAKRAPGSHFGPAGTPASLRARLDLYYADDPGSLATLAMPAPWAVSTDSGARYTNREAPDGPGPVKSASIRPGRSLAITAKSAGGFDVGEPPAGAIIVEVTVSNDQDGSEHRMCTRFDAGLGSKIRYARTSRGRGAKLTLSKGVPVACGCANGVRDGDETDVDCGGACATCTDGAGCAIGDDCESGVCASAVCQAPTCSDGVRNGGETGVDCGGACAACPFACSDDAVELVRLLNEYRASRGKSAVPASTSLCFVAHAHVVDLSEHAPAVGVCNLHSWSDQGPWSPCCYTADHAQAACMWDKPGELTDYPGYGFEVAAGGIGFSPAQALDLWKHSSAHNAVLLSEGAWADIPWRAAGAAFYDTYAVMWFGGESDPAGAP